MWLWPLTGCLRFGWLCLGPGVLGLGVVAWTARSAGKAREVCERSWFVAWACVAWLELCGLRERKSCGLRVPGSVS